MQAEVGELLIVLLPNILDEAVGLERLAEAVGGQAVLGEAPVEEGDDVDGGAAELLLLLDEVGAANEADGALLAEAGEEGQHLGGDILGEAAAELAFYHL